MEDVIFKSQCSVWQKGTGVKVGEAMLSTPRRKYIGNWENGNENGKGLEVEQLFGGLVRVYKGSFVCGEKHGRGLLQCESGNLFGEGEEFVNGLLSGTYNI